MGTGYEEVHWSPSSEGQGEEPTLLLKGKGDGLWKRSGWGVNTGRKIGKDKSDTECRMDWSEGEQEDGKNTW